MDLDKKIFLSQCALGVKTNPYKLLSLLIFQITVFTIFLLLVVLRMYYCMFINIVLTLVLSKTLAEDSIWLLRSPTIPLDSDKPKLMPSLGNGNLGMNVFLPSVRKQCLYSGQDGSSHRTRIPGNANLRVVNVGDMFFTLDMKQGIFEVSGNNDKFTVDHKLLVHRKYSNLILNSITVTPVEPSNEIFEAEVVYTDAVDDTTEDIKIDYDPRTLHLRDNQLGLELVEYICGKTEITEGSYKQESNVCYAWTPISNLLFSGQEANYTKNFITVISDSEEGLQSEIELILDLSLNSLVESHINAWKNIWAKGSILIDGDTELAQTILASMFYIYSSLPFSTPMDKFCGLSPGGLSYGGLNMDYQGHSFWDTEIWMYPSVLALHPEQGLELLKYRIDRLESAFKHAASGGFRGARFPWESALTGSEVCPDFAAETRDNQIHISADISFAARQYLAVTGDLSMFNDLEDSANGCDFIMNIAEFWASRISINEDGVSEILHVMGPDEDHGDVDNNAYTNVAAAYAIYFAEYLGCAANCSYQIPSNYSDMASRLKMEYNKEANFHPQYTGYVLGTEIKQADAILLGYPFMYPMNTSTRVRDLDEYGKVVRSNGPAMTWSMHSVGHVETRNFGEAEKFFNKSYQAYAREPFLVWTEQQKPDIGAVNFLTGMGGFLQAVLFGYAGLRIRLDRIEFTPNLPSNTRSMDIAGIDYYGAEFNLIINENKVIIGKCTVLHCFFECIL